MQRSMVLTVIGADRTGLVESLAQVIADHQGNWLESRMSRLGGQFAGIVRVAYPTEREPALMAGLKNLSGIGLTVTAFPDKPAQAPASRREHHIEFVGHDRPGIVRQISRALASHGVNVEDLESELVSAPMSGEILFRAQAKLSIPPECPLSQLRSELEKIAADLIVDIELTEQPVEPKGT